MKKQYLCWEDQQLEKYINGILQQQFLDLHHSCVKVDSNGSKSQPGKKDKDDIIIAITWMKKIEVHGGWFIQCNRTIVEENFQLLSSGLFFFFLNSNNKHIASCYTHLVSVKSWQIFQIINKANRIQRENCPSI